MKKYEGNSIRNVETNVGHIPAGVGAPSGRQSGGGVLRGLTRKETESQLKLQIPQYSQIKEAAVSLLLIWDDRKARNSFKRKINKIFDPAEVNQVFKFVQS